MSEIVVPDAEGKQALLGRLKAETAREPLVQARLIDRDGNLLPEAKRMLSAENMKDKAAETATVEKLLQIHACVEGPSPDRERALRIAESLVGKRLENAIVFPGDETPDYAARLVNAIASRPMSAVSKYHILEPGRIRNVAPNTSTSRIIF